MKRALRLLLLMGCIALTAGAARANDSAFDGVGGSLRPMKGEHPGVRMVRERVSIDAFARFYDVTADFVFHNGGPATTVTMGFPESGGGDMDAPARARKTGFLRFATDVNGRPVKARRVSLRAPDESGYEAHWVKSVPFKKGETRRVRVQYRAPYGSMAAATGNQVVAYDFTGANWRGDVERSDLSVTLRAPGTYLAAAMWNDEFLAMRRNGSRFERTWTKWQAQGAFRLGFSPIAPGWLSVAGLPDDVFSGLNPPRFHTLTVGRANAATTARGFEFAPPAVRRSGHTFIALSALREFLAAQAEREMKGLGQQEVVLKPQAAGASLQAGRYVFGFRAGEARFSFHDRMRPSVALQMRALPLAPFKAGGRFYVPLAPVLKAMNGTMSLNAKSRRLSLRVPQFPEPG